MKQGKGFIFHTIRSLSGYHSKRPKRLTKPHTTLVFPIHSIYTLAASFYPKHSNTFHTIIALPMYCYSQNITFVPLHFPYCFWDYTALPRLLVTSMRRVGEFQWSFLTWLCWGPCCLLFCISIRDSLLLMTSLFGSLFSHELLVGLPSYGLTIVQKQGHITVSWPYLKGFWIHRNWNMKYRPYWLWNHLLWLWNPFRNCYHDRNRILHYGFNFCGLNLKHALLTL